MFFSRLTQALAVVPLIAAGVATAAIAQNQDPYSDWIYLYDDSFQDSSGAEVSQQWWLKPEAQRSNDPLQFTLLARRNPAGSNGTVAAVFDYVGNCSSLSYSMEKVTFLDSNNGVIDTQTHRRVMEAADPSSNIYGVIDDLCNGAY